MEISVKKWWQSKAIIGSMVSVLAIVLKAFNLDFGVEDQAAFVDAVYAIIIAGGSVFAIYGRVKATKQIK